MSKTRQFLYILLACNIVFIMYQALQTGETSSEISGEVVQVIHDVLESQNIRVEQAVLHELIRNLAHVFQYFTLGVLMALLYIRKKYVWYVGGLLMFLDESIQYVTPGRAFELKDIGLDTMGYSLGILIVLGIYYIIKGRLLCVELLDTLANKKPKASS